LVLHKPVVPPVLLTKIAELGGELTSGVSPLLQPIRGIGVARKAIWVKYAPGVIMVTAV
jgi:hypothetical protein